MLGSARDSLVRALAETPQLGCNCLVGGGKLLHPTACSLGFVWMAD